MARQYSSDEVEIGWQGLDFKEGLAQDTFITEARNVDTWERKAQANGATIDGINLDRSGVLTVLVDQESALSKQLRALYLQDIKTRSIVGPLRMVDTSSSETFVFVNARIKSDANTVRGTTTGVESWVFMYSKKTPFVANVDANVIGA